MAEQKQELADIVEKVRFEQNRDDRTPLGGVPEYQGSDHLLLTINNATDIQVHGVKSGIKMKSSTDIHGPSS